MLNPSHRYYTLILLLLPAAIMALLFALGAVAIAASGLSASMYPWILLGCAILFSVFASAHYLGRHLQRSKMAPVTALSRAIRQHTVNRLWDSALPATSLAGFQELTAEVNHLLKMLADERCSQQQEIAALHAVGEVKSSALQLEIEAHKSAQAKLQTLARELDNRNRQLHESLQQSEVADKAKAEFLSNMSHEIRTPLNAVLGVASLLDRSSLSDRQRQQVGMIFESGKALLGILNDILDYVRIEAGEIELDAFPFNLIDVARSVFTRFGEQAVARGLDYQFHADDHLPALFVGDGARIQQLINSLLDNAIKFTQEGSVCLQVGGIALRNGRFLVRIDVSDSGIGIAPALQSRLFNVFIQGDSSITRAYGGSGLGLAICSRLVNLMQGTLSVESEEGKGALFRVELPLRQYQDLLMSDTVKVSECSQD